MKFVCYDHCGKSLYLKQQLVAAGHEAATGVEGLDLLIVDCDWPWAHPRPALIEAAHDAGAIIATYPHGGRFVNFVYDGLCAPDDRVDLRLEHGPAHIDTISPYVTIPNQHDVGWLYCPTAPFKPVEKPTKILFGPMHPNMEQLVTGTTNGHDPAPIVNQPIYKRLLELPDVEIVVSVIGPAWRNGVWPHPKVRLHPNPNMWFPHTFEQIMSADLVIAADTMAAAAVALGKPTIWFFQGDMRDYIGGQYIEADHANSYRDQTRYPIDFDDGPLDVLISLACDGYDDVDEWRRQWVGNDGTEAAIRLLEEAVADRPVPESQSVTIEGVTARAGAKAS